MAQNWRGQYSRYKDFFLNIAFLYRQRPDLRAFLEVLLSISTIIVFLLFALKPTALTIISLLKEIQEKQVTVAALTQKVNDLKTASDVFTQNQDIIPDVDKSVANAPQPDVVVQQIQGIASKDSVEILGISIDQITLVGIVPVKKTSSDIKPLPESAFSMPISINAKGGFPNLLSFMKDLENLRIITKIDGVSINASNTDSGQLIVVVVSGRVPYLGK